MRKLLPIASLLVPLFASPARADDGRLGQDGSVSIAGQEEILRGVLRDQDFSVKPEMGEVSFVDTLGESASRLALGIGVDWNISSALVRDRDFYLGPQTGIFFAHLGSASSNFVGTASQANVNMPGSNLLLIPADVKAGLNFSDSLRLSVHGGMNVVYRSSACALSLGSSMEAQSEAWGLFPNAGMDFEVGFGRNVSLLFRPDFTFAPTQPLFMGMVGLGLVVG